MIDLRSDTVTQPTESMRKAMGQAKVGDDVYGEDPTVNRLQEFAAELTGKEAALLVSSGTQGNLLGVLARCRRGDEIIVGEQAHIFWNESAGVAALGGIQMHLIPNQAQGALSPHDVEAAIRPTGNPHFPPSTLICLENTHNRCNGGVLTVEDVSAVCSIAHSHKIPVHLDGARIFNAAVYLETPVKDMVRDVDGLTFCLSKGLSCPVGSILCGSEEFITEARRWRKMVGGSMRQAGIIAAAGIVALQSMLDRLAQDHDTAKVLSQGLAQIPGIIHDTNSVQTNILFLDLDPQVGTLSELARRLDQAGVKVHQTNSTIRMVTHRHITPSDVDLTLMSISRIVTEMKKQ